MPQLSVIIPLAPHEATPDALIASLPSEAEVILSQEGGRAISLNQGAAKATGQYLWFLHADSELPHHAGEILQKAIQQKPDALYYFNLAFSGNSPLMALNSWGANLRSRLFGCPFGDQGFCIKASLFDRLGGYPKDAPYGEDHLFVWKAHKAGIKLHNLGVTLSTSPRKYEQKGWLNTTLLHQSLWAKQAWGQLWK